MFVQYGHQLSESLLLLLLLLLPLCQNLSCLVNQIKEQPAPNASTFKAAVKVVCVCAVAVLQTEQSRNLQIGQVQMQGLKRQLQTTQTKQKTRQNEGVCSL